jgi:Tripartite tricarboxylate transporter family receptor
VVNKEIIVVNKNVPAKTLAEFIALAKAQPGKLVFASTGIGGMPRWTCWSVSICGTAFCPPAIVEACHGRHVAAVHGDALCR